MSKIELLQRALHSAKCRIYRINYDLECDISLTHQRKAENQKELMEITVEALEKQMPKKIVVDSGFEGLRYCPFCNVRFIGWGMKYCGECGQALDWRDTK